MLQPRRSFAIVATFLLVVVESIGGFRDINTSPRRRRQDSNDVTTVLLVDSHGRSSFGRFLSVKPDIGLITSTARTFIQEGVTTEYATQVLGTTLDNGRLYAHLLTKTSRVLYDGDSPSKLPQDLTNKKWNIDKNLIASKNFIRNTDYIAPNQVEPVLVFPTTKSGYFSDREQIKSEEEILKESPSNNPRVPYENNIKKDIVLPEQNMKTFKINPQLRDLTSENLVLPKINKNQKGDTFSPSKVREHENLPTFTVRNEFSPSGFSYLGDYPEFDAKTERAKPTTIAERKAKLLFRAGFAKPELKDLQTITYTGFADFTTTVGDTVIVFSPHTSEVPKNVGQITKITVEPTIKPTSTIKLRPSLGTTIKTFFSQKPGMSTQTIEGHKLEMKKTLPTMVIDKNDRHRDPKNDNSEKHEDMAAKSSVLAHEQQIDFDSTISDTLATTELIEPSESETPMLSTPSDEDIAKIFAMLQSQAKKATQPLNTPATIFFDDITSDAVSESTTQQLGGAKTIFFDDDDFNIESTRIQETTTTKIIQNDNEEDENETNLTTVQDIVTTEKLPETTLKEQSTTSEIVTTTENDVITTEDESHEATTEQKESNDEVICTEGSRVVPTTAYKTLTYLTTFFIPIDDASTTTSIKANEVISTEISFETKPCSLLEEITPSSVTEKIQTTHITTTEEQSTTEEITTELHLTTTTEEQKPTFFAPKEEDYEEEEEEEEKTDLPTTTELFETTPDEITTERRHVTESEPETTEMTTESGEEIELIFKTLYTTYTYLTTYFQDTTSSIASRIVVTTNVITSTLDPASEATDPAVAGLFEREDSLVPGYKTRTVSFDDFAEIAPNGVNTIQPSSRVYSDDDNLNEDEDEENDLENTTKPTPTLSDDKLLKTNGIKTYYTTYTYFTTIFVDGQTEISSRTEVYTNYVTPSLNPTTTLENILPTALNDDTANQAESPEPSIPDDNENEEEEEDEDDENIKKKIINLNVTPLNTYNSTINRQKTALSDENDRDDDKLDIYASITDKLDNNILTVTSINKEQNYVTLQRNPTTEDAPIENNILNLNEYETISTMVTDVRSSTSEGDRRIIDNVDKRNVLDDQIVSESNNDSEIIPSPTLLLQTSYTTFTYFTTMYHGTTSSNVVSRLETITNVVTETLTPTHTLSVDDLTLPITYFTTFTYWTTLYKDGTTKVTSREETISNIVTPTPSQSTDLPTITTTPIVTSLSSLSKEEVIEPTPQSESIQPSTVGDDDLTTYFTTYTYYTTSYVGNSTVLNSRLETVTNILNNTADIESNQIARAIGTVDQNQIEDETKIKIKPTSTIRPTGLLSTVLNTVENSGTTTILSTDVYGTYIDGVYAEVQESTSSIKTPTIAPSSVKEQIVKPTGIVSINKGKIVDAEGVSTLFYTTQAVGTYIDNLYAQVIESTSSLKVNEERLAALATDVPINHRTGLVRLIQGSIVQNQTTTLYESKVLGTVIDGRYAQIIESTSSFLVGSKQSSSSSIKPSSVVSEIVPTSTNSPKQQIASTTTPIAPSPVVIEGSISDSSKIDEENTTEEIDEDNEDEENTRTKSRLTFQTKKRTFTPVIRPFASRPRPTFAPKRKGSGPSTATTVTRSDVTPTVTAVPASKPSRFGGRRSSSSSAIVPTASGSRRFSRPKSSSAAGSSSSRRSSSRVQPTSSRRGGFRSSTQNSQRASSRFRIHPTLASSFNRSPNSNSVTQASIDNEENGLTTPITDNPTDALEGDNDTTVPVSTTTEGPARRNQNPLLKFRRPPLARPPPTSRATTQRSNNNNNNNNNNNRNSNNRNLNRGTTTTAKPKTSFTRSSLLNRPRANSLFPRRGLFTTTTTPPPEEAEEDLEEEEIGENEDEDTDYEGSQRNTQTASPPTTQEPRRGRARAGSVQIKPFSFRRRSKRQTNFSRFRRPNSRTTAAPEIKEPETEAPPKTNSRSGKSNRFSPRVRSKTTTSAPPPPTRKRISPSKASSQGRSQFTLRENKDSTPKSNFRRPSNSGSRPRTTTVSSRPKSPRLKNEYQTERTANYRKPTVSRSSSRNSRRGHIARSKSTAQDQVDNNFVLPQFDGTITVTHHIPTEVTIPVVNGKITEYKNIVTAKYSTEILDPRQYSTSLNAFGKDVTVLLSESTSIGDNGATLITQFVLNETPTTSVIFTPTYIRGRKTSFSHVIPSTAYGIDQVVNTIQPALAAQAPLANILLSQLLLGGLQPQNPLLGLQNPALPATPTTEYKTRTTTYVTTVTSETSTVIPLTFRGKEILTTIIDSSVNVVTATEFLTDTIVATPTLGFPGGGNQLNTLLLPLLQQQLQQPLSQPGSPLLQQPAGVYHIESDKPQAQALYQEPDNFNLASDDEVDQLIPEESTEAPRRKSRGRKNKEPKPAPVAPPKETSVITLYVSGRTPGEFSTVLSTVVVGENERRKRELVKPSKSYEDLIISTLDYFDTYVMPASKEIGLESGETRETESLESIIGDVTKHIKTKTDEKATKYKNLTDLDEKAPLMPKVETLPLTRGKQTVTKLNNLNYVSNNIGSYLEYKNSRETHVRSKRNSDTNQQPRRRRIVKKLRRVKPVSSIALSNDYDYTSTEFAELDHTTRKNRRRLIIKKKKKKLLNPINNSLNSDEIQQDTKLRRKIIVTRKRLLPKNTQIESSPTEKSVVKETDELVNQKVKSEESKTKQLDIAPIETNEKITVVDIETTEADIIESITSKDWEIPTTYKTDVSLQEESETIQIDNFEATEPESDISEEHMTSRGNLTTIKEIPEETSEENKIIGGISTEQQHVPDYEPFFPELTESFDSPILLLKTTILSSVELITKTVVESRLRTYTFIVTRVNGDEQIVTSTTEVKPHTKTVILTEPHTKLTTLTLLDFDATSTLNPIPMTSPSFPSVESSQLNTVTEDFEGRAFEEARYNLATRVMSNGVEVIVAGDKSTLPGEPDVKRILPSSIFKPVTLKPSTLSDHMMMMLPQEASNINSLTASLYPNQFVTKTCLTTFTYLTTYLESGSTTVSSHEQVVSNIATEERNTGKILPTPAMGITLTQYPNLSVGIFHTTYTYLNTILDGEQPIVVTSKHTVTNTVTAPDDYLSLLQPSEKMSAQKDTNTYYSTMSLEKTLYEGKESKVISTNEVVTQVVITESVPPKATSVMTSYIALDVENTIPLENLTTTDVVKTYFVTYTYYNTMLENGNTVVKTNVSTSSDVVTEKLFLHPKRTTTLTSSSSLENKKKKLDMSKENFLILATKTYHTTFTYFTTLLQEQQSKPTVISSHSKVVENIVTETIDPTLLDKKYLKSIKSELEKGPDSVTKFATLNDGQKLEITVILNEINERINPTKVLPIEKTELPTTENRINLESSTPSVITGSTIIFLDDEPQAANLKATPSLKPQSTSTKNNLGSLLSSEIVKKTKISISTSKIKRNTKTKTKPQSTTIIKPSKSSERNSGSSSSKLKVPSEKQPTTKIVPKPANQVTDLLGLGSININSLQALTPVLSAMAGLIETNLKSNRRNDTQPPSTTTEKNLDIVPAIDIQNRSPIYIPVGGIGTDIEVAESQNIATFHLQETVDWNDEHKNQVHVGKPTHESPLLNGGIPISPGDVITTNSDVIVGKPGRILPRIPSIPLNQIKDDVEVPIGMKPPPVPNKIWPKRNHEYKHIPVNNLRKEKPVSIIHAPNKDDYVGPPPPPLHKHKHIPLNRPIETAIYAENQNNYGVSYGINEVNHGFKIPNIKEEIQKNYELASKETIPIYAQIVPGIPINDYNIQPSVLNEPIVHPEIIERSTGQPLLVNIQPSQVAFVNIPHNRTTALIYGGSTEPHRNGQYFDDPSPYPQPEFSGIESFNQGVPQFASIYHDTPSNQKEVAGVIKVGTQSINVEPSHQPSEHQVQTININPTRPQNGEILLGFQNNHEVNVNVPPISFGMVQQDNDFNAHIINHGDIQFNPPPLTYDVIRNKENRYEDKSHPSTDYPNHNPSNQNQNKGNRHQVGDKTKLPPKKNFSRPRPKPSGEISEFMTPPPFKPLRTTNKEHYSIRPNSRPKKPLPIPLIPEINIQQNFNSYNNQNMKKDDVSYHHEDTEFSHGDTAEDEDDDDLINEDGEVIQESNSRPLRPGQVPYEILKTTTTTTEKIDNNQFSNFNNEINRRPVISYPRPFGNVPIVRPDNAQTNQIISYDQPQQNIFHHQGFHVLTTNRPRRPSTSNSPITHKTRTTTTTPTISTNQNFHQQPTYRITTYKPTTKLINLYNFDNERPTTMKTTLKPITFAENIRRPQVTSLPIDTQTAPPKKQMTPNTQTEKPFEMNPDKIEISKLQPPKSHEIHRIPNTTSMINSDLEIMKPPPFFQPQPSNPNLESPQIEVIAPGSIQRVPNIPNNQSIDQEAHANTPQPFIPKRPENIVPQPPKISNEEVVGMSPPPLASTYRPIIRQKPTSTEKPIFSLELDPPKEVNFVRSTSTNKPRRPITRRPVHHKTTSTTTESNYPIYNNAMSNITENKTNITITPSPTIKNPPTLEVIIGNPNLNVDINKNEETTTKLKSSEIDFVQTTQITSSTPEIILQNTATTHTIPIHHAGNEVKIVDESKTSIAENKTLQPTRYLTYTKTSTVTITKTTVVKTLGGPPSTLTLLVTKTEKSTIVDTVTEFHTLVKPTNIIETITTTIKQSISSLYPPEVYSSTYPSIQIRPTSTNSIIKPTLTVETDEEEEDLEDFIINETDPPIEPQNENDNSESIFVVMTDKSKGSVIKIPHDSYETQDRDEILADNEANNVLLGGVLIANRPSLEVPHAVQGDKCNPECKASRNELCQKVEGIMRCICRPGFARMFPDRPCIPTYTYSLNIDLERYGRENLHYTEDLSDKNSTKFLKLAAITHEALDRMVMQSDLRDIYHGVHVHSYEPSETNGIKNKFYLQLSDNMDEHRLQDVFKKYLRNNNFSLGGTEMFAARESLDDLDAEDFDECTNPKFHDCSENAQCFNLKGTYTCSCKEGYTDLSENILYPGRVCSAELIGCERCNYHGTCYSRGNDQILCECFHWYTGESCHINLKVLLIALVTLGTMLFALLLICIIITCVRRKPRSKGMVSGMSFLPQRVGNGRNRSTIDRRAMIQDTSSEDSRSENNTLPYIAKKQKKLKGALKKPSNQNENGETTIAFSDQKDRSLTVMIPRAKYHPAPPTNLMNYTTFDARKPSVPSTSNDAKLLSYLDAGPSPNKLDKRKSSNAQNEAYRDDKMSSRKTSGALVSAGFEVSATVNMGTLGGTTCGTEADRSENATLIQKISADLLSSTGTRSQFNTLRNTLVENDIDPMVNWLDITPRITTVSEARSYDETTIPPQMKSFRNGYDSKPSSQHQNDEANTMAERDLGSTFLLPHTHLYKPDRGSDISGFESL